MLRLFILLLFASLINSQQNFNYNSTYSCTSDNSTSLCTNWSYNVTLQETPSTQCFPADQLVVTQTGVKQMKDLKIGDLLLAYDYLKGQKVYTPIKSWLHKLDNNIFSAVYRKIQTNYGIVYISNKHNIAIQTDDNNLEYIFAENLEPGQKLFGNQTTIISNTEQIKRGLYAPSTELFNFYIAASQQSQKYILVHCFANIQNPTFYQSIYAIAQNFLEYIGIIDNKSNHSGISQFNQMLMKIFPNLVEQQISKNEFLNTDVVDIANNQQQQQQNTRKNTIITFLSIINVQIFNK